MTDLKCTKSDCLKTLKNVDNMSLNELDQQSDKCSTCGAWLFKEQEHANKTYIAIANKWATEFMKKLYLHK